MLEDNNTNTLHVDKTFPMNPKKYLPDNIKEFI